GGHSFTRTFRTKAKPRASLHNWRNWVRRRKTRDRMSRNYRFRSRIGMRARLSFWRLCLASAFLCWSSSVVAAQQGNRPSIRVESNLVEVHVEVYHKRLMHGASAEGLRCRTANTSAFYKLPPSEPFTPWDCHYDIVIHGLRAKDFHVFEDGVEQKLES